MRKLFMVRDRYGVVKERSRCRILLDVLRAVREEKRITKTRMMQRSCLGWRCFKRYFDFLVQKSFIVRHAAEKDLYGISERGLELLNLLRDLDRLYSE